MLYFFRLPVIVCLFILLFRLSSSRPAILGPIAEMPVLRDPPPPSKALLDDFLEPYNPNSFDGFPLGISGADFRPLDYGYLPSSMRNGYLGNRLKGTGYTSLLGINYESAGFRDEYYSAEAFPQLVGTGQVRVNGLEAELTCQFPPTLDLVSNIVWEKLERNGIDRADNWVIERQDPRFFTRQNPTGSRLVIGEYTARDEGIYRCIATRRDPNHFKGTRTVYQDIPFLIV